MLKRFFSRLRSPRKTKSEHKSNKKTTYFWKTRNGKIGIGIAAVILVVTVVLFNKQIDNLLRLWGIKAQNPIGEVTIQVDPLPPHPGIAYPNRPAPDNTAEYDITIHPNQETYWGDQIFMITIEELYVHLINGTEVKSYIVNGEEYATYGGWPPPDGLNILEGQPPIVFVDDTPSAPIRLTIVTQITTEPLDITKKADFVVIPTGFYNVAPPSEPGVTPPVTGTFTYFTLILDAGAPLAGDFSITVELNALSPNQAEDDIDRTVPGGYLIYDVTVTRLNGWTGTIDATHDLITGWPDDIASVVWEIEGPTPDTGRFVYDFDPSNLDANTMTLTINIRAGAIAKNIDFTVTGTGIIDGTPTPKTDVPANQSFFKITDYTMIIGVHDFDPTEPEEKTVGATVGMVTYRVYGTATNDFRDDVSFVIVWKGNLTPADIYELHISSIVPIVPTQTGEGGLFNFYADVIFNIKSSSPGTNPDDIRFAIRATGANTGLVRTTTNDGILNITTARDFSITVALNPASPNPLENGNPPSAIRTVPGGYLIYDVTVTRLNGWPGDIDATHDLINPITGWPDDIASATWEIPDPSDPAIGQFLYNPIDPGNNTMTLTINIRAGAIAKNIDFTVTGTGIIDGTPTERTDVPVDQSFLNQSFFKITDYTMTIGNHIPNTDPDIKTVGATVGTVTYRVYGRALNDFRDDNLNFAIVWKGNLTTQAQLSPHIVFPIDAIMPTQTVEGQFDFYADVTFKINPSSPGTNPDDIRFAIRATGVNTGLIRMTTNDGILNITTAQDFAIALSFESSTSDIASTAVPYGTITYRVTATRFSGWNGPVILRTENLNAPRFNGAIVSATFTNGGVIDPLPASPIVYLTLEISALAPAISITDFMVYGDGIVNSVPVTHSDVATFNIIDFTITVTALPTHWGETPAGQVHDDITYLITVTGLNNYTGTINLTSNLNLWSADDIDMSGTSITPNSFTLSVEQLSVLQIKTKLTISGPKDINFTVTGTDPNKTTVDSANFYNRGSGLLTVTNLLPSPNFSIQVTPRTLNMIWSDESNFDVTVTPLNGFEGSIYLGHNVAITPEITYASLGLPPIGHLDFEDSTPQTIPLTIRTGNLSGAYLTIDYYVTGTGYYDDTPNPIPGTSNPFNISVNDAPNFRITITPNYHFVYPNGFEVYRVTLERQNGFTGSVTLNTNAIAISGGRIISATFSPDNVITSTETYRDLVLLVDNQEIAGGPYTFTVTGSGGPGNRTDQAQLEILLTPVFTIEIVPGFPPDVRTTSPGGPAVFYDIYVRTASNFVGTVTLTHNLPIPTPVASATFRGGINQLTFIAGDTEKSTILDVTAATGIPDQNVDFFITGNGTVQSNNARLEITNLKDFTLSMEPEKSVFPGDSANYIVTLHRLNFFAGEVTISANIDLPALINLPIIIENNGIFVGGGTVDQDLVLTITSRTTASSSDVLITVSGTSVDMPGIIKETSGILHIFNFRISIREDSQDVIRGQSATYTVDLLRENGFNRAITLSTTDLTGNPNLDSITPFTFANGGTFPAGAGNGTTALTINTIPTAALTTIKFSVIGTDVVSSQERNDSANLNILDNNPDTPDFTLTVTPDSQTVEPGGSTSYTITITKLNGFSETIVLSTNLRTNNPDEILQITFAADPFNPGVTNLQVVTKSTARSSTDPITFTVFGTAPSITRSDSADLIIYKATGGGGGGGTVIPPVVPPVTPPIPPVVPPVVPPATEPEIPETLPSTGADVWLWIIIAALLTISLPQHFAPKKKE